MTRQTKRSGFTLIELTLAMTFISILLLTIALTVMRVATIYNRGMTLKEVNQTARNISDDLRRTVVATGEYNLAIGTVDGEVDNNNYFEIRNSGNVTLGGRLCLGTYSYVWNTAQGIETAMKGAADKEWVAFNSEIKRGQPVRVAHLVHLQKVPDPGRVYCQKSSQTSNKPRLKDIRNEDESLVTELVKAGDRNIAVQNMVMVNSTLDPASGQGLYRIAYTLGTGDTSAMTDDRTACRPPDDPNSNLEYCNIQRFMVVLRTGGGVSQ